MIPAPDIADAIRAHARKFDSVEVCGLIFAGPGKKGSVIRPCANVAANPRVDFAISVDEMEQAQREAGSLPLMVYHSEATVSSNGGSEADRQWSKAAGIPYLIYDLGPDRFHLIQPPEYELDYEGRPFAWGVLDCFALARDWYCREHRIILPNPARGPLFWRHADLFVDNLNAEGWTPVPFGEWRAGDLLLFAINVENQNPGNVANHCGVLLDDGTLMLHHLEGRKSRIEPFNSQCSPWFPHLYKYPTQSAWRAPEKVL